MRAVQIDVHGGPEVLTVREVADPAPGAGEVLVRTVASSLNPVDWKTRAWDVGPALPATLGWDLAGIVVASDSARFAVGDRVIAMSAQLATGLGTWAELVRLPERLLAHAPATLTLPRLVRELDAAGVPLLDARLRPPTLDDVFLRLTGAAAAETGERAA